MNSEMLREITLSEYVGFDNLPSQIMRKCLQENHTFNILCVGETGIGKSTLISSLFNIDVDNTRSHKHTNSVVRLVTRKYDLKEKEVSLRLSVTETVGYGDQINKEENFEPILKYVDLQFDKYLDEELKVKRKLSGYRDTRIHVCLYFICPTGRTLKAADLLALKHLSSKINVVPIIAKADLLTKEELQNFKSNIRKELEREKIETFQFQPLNEADSDSKVIHDVPFAVVGSMDFVENDGKLIRGRNYPWGTILIENENHSDFIKLRELLIEMHMEDLTSSTHARHYENYRKKRLKRCGIEDGDEQMNLLEKIEAKRQELRRQWQQEEEEFLQSFVEKAKTAEKELAEEEKMLKLKYRTMQEQNEKELMILDEENKLLQEEIHSFYKNKKKFENRKKPLK